MKPKSHLRGTRVYLSGPMDFVASRAQEMKFGWRNRVGQFLRAYGATVFDPWNKPDVRGLHEYGKEGPQTNRLRKAWSFAPDRAGAAARAKCSGKFWETLHIDLRMVDTSDFTIAYCPTNIYSVGSPHEIALCRQQHKPVLFVSPPVTFLALEQLRRHLASDHEALRLLGQVENEVPIKPNPRGIPSLWYIPLVGGDHFFDGFGFHFYRKRFRWKPSPLDVQEQGRKLENPLLPFLEKLNKELPKQWDSRVKKFVPNDDWLLWDL
jgi:hypothetical protein